MTKEQAIKKIVEVLSKELNFYLTEFGQREDLEEIAEKIYQVIIDKKK